MNVESVSQPLPALVVEYVELELLGIELEPDGPIVSTLLAQCVAVLASAGVTASTTRLVVTGDFVQSVRDRGDSEYHANYNTRRNAGSVGGKTIRMADGTVDVLVPAGLFLTELDEDAAAAAAALAMRTVLHEAQHVVIQQAGEAGSSFEGQEWARRNFLTAADQVIEEYRAEAVCARVAGGTGWSADLATPLETWLVDLQRIACEEYQEHLDAGRLSYDILQETHTVWKLLGYVAADLTGGSSLSPAATGHRLWRRMVEPHWERFLAILRDVPDAGQRVPRSALDAAAVVLADEFAAWLLTLGFEFSDHPGGATFWIRDWSLLEGND